MDYRRKENQLIAMIDKRRKPQKDERQLRDGEVRSWHNPILIALNLKYAGARK